MAEIETGFAPSGSGLGPDGSHQGLADKAREKMSGAGDVARRKVLENLDGRKASLSSNLEHWAEQIENMEAGSLGSQAAHYVRRAQGLLNEKSSDELLSMALKEIRGRPGVVIAGAFVLGFLGARVLRT